MPLFLFAQVPVYGFPVQWTTYYIDDSRDYSTYSKTFNPS